MQETEETWVQFLGQEDPLEKEMATHSSILALENPMDRGGWWAIVHGVTRVGCVRAYMLMHFSCVKLFVNLWTVAH